MMVKSLMAVTLVVQVLGVAPPVVDKDQYDMWLAGEIKGALRPPQELGEEAELVPSPSPSPSTEEGSGEATPALSWLIRRHLVTLLVTLLSLV